MMSNYNLIVEKDNIKILKKKNKFKIEIYFEVEPNCDIIEKFKNDDIYKILKALNKDIIEHLNINNKNDNLTDITIVFNNFNTDEDDDDTNDEKYFLSFTRHIKSNNNNSIIIDCDKNSTEFVKDKFKKLDLNNLNINLIIDENNNLNLIIKIKYNGESLPVYLENYVAKIFGKMFLRLIKYFGKKD